MRFSLHPTIDTCHAKSRLGFPSEIMKVLSKNLNYLVWCISTSALSSLPLRVLDYWAVGFRATPTAVGSLLLLARGSPVLLWLRCCCLLLNITAAGSGWPRLVQPTLPVTRLSTPCWRSLYCLYSYLLNAGAMAGSLNVSFDIIFKLNLGLNLIRIFQSTT